MDHKEMCHVTKEGPDGKVEEKVEIKMQSQAAVTDRKEKHHVVTEGPGGKREEKSEVKVEGGDRKEKHQVTSEGPAGKCEEKVEIKEKGAGTLDHQKDVKIKQDYPGMTRTVEEHVSTGEKDEGVLDKLARKVGLKD